MAQWRQTIIIATASATLTLPEAATVVNTVKLGNGTAGEMEALTVVPGTPDAGDVQFAGTPNTPSTTLTLNTAATAGIAYHVEYATISMTGAA